MKKMLVIGLSTAFLIAGCADTAEEDIQTETDRDTQMETDMDADMDQEDGMSDDSEAQDNGMMDMDHSGKIPDGLVESEDPTYPVGSTVIITGDHMPGMEGAEATISGAFETTIYEVSFTPTTGGERVRDHRWVIQEDLEEGAGNLEPGDEVVLEADHMEGMHGATAVVEEAIRGTVYAVDYHSTIDGERVTNHMWMTEDELEPAD